MTGNHDRIFGRCLQISVGGEDHSIDVAAGGVIDERVDLVPECIGNMQHVGLDKMNVNVAICVGRLVMFICKVERLTDSALS